MGTQKKKNSIPQEQTPSTAPIAIVGMAEGFQINLLLDRAGRVDET